MFEGDFLLVGGDCWGRGFLLIGYWKFGLLLIGNWDTGFLYIEGDLYLGIYRLEGLVDKGSNLRLI